MTTFIVKRHLPGITMQALGEAQALAIDTCKKMTDDGMPINYIRSNYFPAEDNCYCMFEADAARIVEKMNDDASLPYDEVTEVVDLPHP